MARASATWTNATLPGGWAGILCATMAAAPRLTASSRNEAPSARIPGSAKKRFPGTTLRLSITSPEIGRSRLPFEARISPSLK